MQRQNSVSPATGCVAAFPFPMMKQNKLENLPNTSPVEKLYRYMWRRKVGLFSRHGDASFMPNGNTYLELGSQLLEQTAAFISF